MKGSQRLVEDGRNSAKNIQLTRAIRLTTKPDTIKDRRIGKPLKKMAR